MNEQLPAAPATVTAETVLSVRAVSKSFGRARVLDSVNLDMVKGEIHALIGQNGSGKSTLVKILSGIHQSDSGQITAHGNPLSSPVHPNELRREHMAFVHQDLGLVTDLSVVENIRIGSHESHRWTRWVNRRADADGARAALEALHASVSLKADIRALPAGTRALIAIARAMQSAGGAGQILIFDEATQSLPRESIDEFYATIRETARRGASVLMVTHRLDEVLKLANRVTVLRDGAAVAEGMPVAGLDEAALSHLLLGRSLEGSAASLRPALPPPGAPARETVLRASAVTGGHLRGASLELARGEVVGVTGPAESGYDELPYLLAGVARGSGELTVNGVSLQLGPSRIRDHRQAGIALVPQHRLEDGLAAGLTAVENMTLPRVAERGRWLLRRGWQTDEFSAAVRRLRLTPTTPNAPVASFSGGNQQKILLAKWGMDEPAVLITHEPTQAVDVGARIDILRALREAAAQGGSVMMSSLEANDLALVCDRVLVMREGRVHDELIAPDAETITAATYGAQLQTRGYPA